MTSLFNILLQYRGSWLVDIPRQILGWVDAGVYSLISSVYGLIEDLAHVQIFDEGTLSNFYNKIYVLLTIFMLFKISFSIVSYLLDPAKATDKTTGFGKLFINIVIMFAMLLSAPIAFKYLTKLQNAILDDNVLMNFVLQSGDSSDEYTSSNKVILGDSENCSLWNDYDYSNKDEYTTGVFSTTKNSGDYLAVSIYRVFFNIGDPTDSDSSDTMNGTRVGNGMDEHTGKLDVKSGGGVWKYMCTGKRYNVSVPRMVSYMNAYIDEVDEAGSNGYYIIDYKFGVATVVGVVALLMLISIAFDVAIRAIKLSFYQLIAPVPIVSYIDPKSGKNGMFNHYIKELGKTWASLFIRLFSLYFAIFIIKTVDTNIYENLSNSGYTPKSSNFFISLFVILGALMFAKQLPQIIEGLFPGMKMEKMQLNPFKKISEEAMGGKTALGTAALAGGLAIGAVSRMGNLAKKTVDKMKEANTPEKRLERHGKRLDKINNNTYKRIDRNAARVQKNKQRLNEKLDKVKKEQIVSMDDFSKTKSSYNKKIAKAETKAEKDFKRAQERYNRELNRYSTGEDIANAFSDLKQRVKGTKEKITGSTAGKIVGGAKNLVVQSGTILSQALTAGKIAFKDAQGLKFNVQKIGHESARVRNYKDEYNFADRMKDRATDFFGVRGSSGTSSEIANKITDLSMDLGRINQSLSSIGTSIANMQASANVEGMTQVVDGKLTINNNYSGSAENMKVYNRLKELYAQQEQLLEARQSTEKAIKKQEKIKGMPGDFKK